MGIVYRTFRNDDPPKLKELWNDALTSRGVAYLPHADVFERFVFNKPWFDPTGLILAVDEASNRVIGMVHSGFGLGDGALLNTTRGVIPLLVVHPEYLRQKIGWTLLTKAEAWLDERGAKQFQVGCRWPNSPFYWGLIGGSSPVGILNSFENAKDFLAAAGYQVETNFKVLERNLEEAISLGYPRFASLRRKYAVQPTGKYQEPTLYGEATRNIHEGTTFEIREVATDSLVGLAHAWEMKFFTLRWKKQAMGIYGFELQPELRGIGLGKYALSQILRHLHDNFYQVVELNVPAEDTALLSLMDKVGFKEVDEGSVYTKVQ